MQGLLGIFTALDYKEWQNDAVVYRGIRQDSPNFMDSTYDPVRWMCDRNDTLPCTRTAALSNASVWKLTPDYLPIKQCLSERTSHEACKLQYSTVVLSIIIGCDVVKTIVVLGMLTLIRDDPCVTVGDLVADFLTKPDTSTMGRCLLDQDIAARNAAGGPFSRYQRYLVFDGNMGDDMWSAFGQKLTIWHREQSRLYHAASPERWLSFGIL